MNPIKKFATFWRHLGCLIVGSFLFASVVIAQGTATYELTFTATWTAGTHPSGFPSNPHFSGMIGGTHNDAVQFWSTGETASDGIKQMAEFGAQGTLRSEIEQAIRASNADAVISASVFNSPGNEQITFEIRPPWNLVTVTSMLAPSPDWFVGVSGLNLLDENRNWIDVLEVELFVYDAGTDSGPNYTSPDQATNPREAIRRIQELPFLVNGVVKPVGTFRFELQKKMEIAVSPASLTVDEGTSNTFDVSLSARPTGSVVVSIPAFTNTNLTRDREALTFTSSNYSTPQAVTVSAAQDSNSDNETEIITLMASGGGYESLTQAVEITVKDSDVADATIVVDDSLTVVERDATPVDLAVSLSELPTGTVTVTVTNSNPMKLEVRPGSLMFTAANWDTEQTIALTAVHDLDWRDETVGLTFAASGGGYGSADSKDVSVTIIDNDDPPTKLAPDSLVNMEEASTIPFSVELLVQPTHDVTVTISSNDPMRLESDRMSVILSPQDDDWRGKSITLSAKEDSDFMDDRVSLTLTAESIDAQYDGVTQTVSVMIQDNDSEVVSVQFIQNIIGADVDLYLNGTRHIDDFSFQSAKPLSPVEAGSINLEVVAANTTNRDSPLFSDQIILFPDSTYQVILQGKGTDNITALVLSDDQKNIPEDTVGVRIIHGAPDLGQVDIQVLDQEIRPNVIEVLGSGLKYGDSKAYTLLPSEQYNIAVYESSNNSVVEVYTIDWSQSSKRRGVLILSGNGSSAAEGLSILGIWESGDIYFPSLVTSIQEDQPMDISSVTAGNFPNPFRGTTYLWFNLQETVDVEIEVIDVLGRTAFSSVAGRVKKGERYQYEINTTGWPSGVYFYRIIASTTNASATVFTGKMTRIK